MKKDYIDSCDNNCGLFDFMANTIGIKVLHPGGYDATDKLISQFDLNKTSNVLDLACGVGTTSFYLSNKFDCNVTGIDISTSLIDIANNRLTELKDKNKIKFEVANALKLPFPDNTFDFVIAQAFFILIDEKDIALNEIYRVLKPNGYFGSLELSWFKTPTQDAYDELLKNTCNNFIPRVVKFEEWELFFKSKGLKHEKTIKNPMPSGMLRMIKNEGLINSMRIMYKMISNSQNRKRMMAVQNAFGKYNDYLGYGIFCYTK